MNYFAYESAAKRYQTGRPYFHPQIIDRISTYLSLYKPVASAIDVGCGTGLSTLALKSLAERVVGVDIAEEMIVLAPHKPNISYVVSPAEQLPFRPDSFDLVTVSQAFHWTSRNDFLAEARRVLHKYGWLIIYDNYFSGQMEGNEKFELWVEECYNREYPSPPRASVSFGNEDAEKEGFQFISQDIYSNSTAFSHEGLVSYLMTHSNVIAAVEGGNQNAIDVQDWLREGMAPFFEKKAEAIIRFNAPIWYLQKLAG
jgi:ubiquinone/menaquinone biosynthesis C-methylase UbiE